MKKRLLFFVFLLILPIVFSQDWVFNSEYAILNLDISGNVNLVPTSPRYEIEYVIVNLSFIPQDGFQEEVLDINTEPLAEIEDNTAMFRWDEPKEKELSFSVNSNVKVSNKIVKVRNEVKFPLFNLPDEVLIYTNPSETIDSDDKEIIKKASEIISGENDLYVIVFKLADWTKKNIKYDLSTLTESVSQKASWVLENKEGVCDELTNLFIAMNRALGIPAKFISGVAYTNSESFGEGFGPHGWAEVYFPGYGWIPFDVTFGEFGFIDAGHIKLKESLDANDASIRFQWLGKNVDIKTTPLDINAEVKNTKGRVEEGIEIDARAVKDDVGFGSYNLIEADVRNLKDYYLATELVLSRSREIEIIGEERKSILLKPLEEGTVSWIIKVSDNLERGYMYTFPFVVSSLRNVSSKMVFDSTEDGDKFSLKAIESLVKEDEEEKSLSGNVELSCELDNEEIYLYESVDVGCNIKNVGSVYLEGLNVCLESDCQKISLGIIQEEKINFDFKPKDIGSQEMVIRATNDVVDKAAFYYVTVYDEPSLKISDLNYPTEIEYNDDYEISFVLNKESRFSPYNLSIKVEPIGKEWELNQLNENRKFILKMYGSELKAGENNFKILVGYKDKNGKNYEASGEFDIRLVNVNIFQRIAIFFKGIGKGIVGVFK